MLMRDLISAMGDIAPLQYAEPWDNVGLLVGDPAQSIAGIMLTIDYTKQVAEEAACLHCDAIIAYHPPLFAAVKRITTDGQSNLIHDAIRRGVSIYSPHTAWDVATGGTNDVLAELLGLTNCEPLRLTAEPARYFKLVTFVPEQNIETVRAALAAAGAGHIGGYSACSFQSPGIGIFFPEVGTNPAIGKPGTLERTPEIRLETILPIKGADAVIRALRQSHPYEEPAFDLTVVAAPPPATGQGRVGMLSKSTSLNDVLAGLKKELNLSSLLVAGEMDKTVMRVAVCAGSGGDLLDAAIASKADLFVTGELRHHDALKAIHAGVAVICTLHSNSERISLKRLKSRLEQALAPAARPPVFLSQSDRDPFAVR